uniref:Reverse transcriptase Ty1/copia-type domain-containing protein n=1 Tax=Vitis vinifera TaxID=29760 RepID=A5AUK6_VITVI|nr:hypothetical protein VITISV_003256 [Vitis vinifera]
MSSELTALMKHGTWDLVPIPLSCNLVGCKWVFRVKRKPNGSVDRFKARLVATGYNQRPNLYYKETSSPEVKPATIRTVLSIVVVNGWDLRQMDVNNAFLHGALSEIVYMMQPSGFKDPSKPNHVCRLKKAIYGLKQAPRAWYTTLENVLLELGFDNSRADLSLFIYRKHSIICYFLVYVDDLVIIGNNTNFVASIIKQLGDRFFLKDMGLLHCLLGVEVVPTKARLFLSQHKYIRELLSTTNMSGAKVVSTPLSITQSLKLLDGTTNVDNTEFRRIIGSLQYLSLKRPDISFAVNKLSQFMHKPTTIHFTTTKRLLRYSKQTIFHGSNPISWSSKKQRAVARSTTEAEYRALANVTFETMWFLGLLHELDFSLKAVSLLLCDNLGATHLSFNLVQHSRMKHIQIDLHFVCDLVQRGSLQVRQVHTQDQLADLLIKPLSRQRTELLRHKIRLADGSSILRGRIKTKTDCKDQGND